MLATIRSPNISNNHPDTIVAITSTPKNMTHSYGAVLHIQRMKPTHTSLNLKSGHCYYTFNSLISSLEQAI